MNSDLPRRITGTLALVALSLGLLGATVTACSVTGPDHFHQDSTRGTDSTNQAQSLGYTDGSEIPLVLTGESAG